MTDTVVAAVADADAPRLAVSSDPAITRTLNRDRMSTSPAVPDGQLVQPIRFPP